jgi:hypothetical protein
MTGNYLLHSQVAGLIRVLHISQGELLFLAVTIIYTSKYADTNRDGDGDVTQT